MSDVRKDSLSQLMYEAQSYQRIEDIEKLVDAGTDLSVIPLQPLYVALKSTTLEQLAELLPKLSPDQRQALRDVDIWNRDELDPVQFNHWLDVYSKCSDEKVILEFIKSEDFLLGLKSQMTIYTFDVEDPQYPEDDNYFLTEDNLLLIAYPEDFTQAQELKQLIRRLYSEEGVENAYSFLFKMVSDSYLVMEESEYGLKRDRLRDFGFVEYYEALEFNKAFTQREQIDHFIKKHLSPTGSLSAISKNQSLHSSALVPFQGGMSDLRTALEKITDEKRQRFLQFSFIRLVNAQLTLADALKHGTIAVTKTGQRTRQCLELGFDYAFNVLGDDAVIFQKFDFKDIYRIGFGLLEWNQRRMKNNLSQYPFDGDELSYFLGMYWNAFLENSLMETPRYKFDGSSKAHEINTHHVFQKWVSATDSFMSSLPYIERFFAALQKLKKDGRLNDLFYLNYEVDNMDFEAIIISSFINFSGGLWESSEHGKMGVTINELRSFYHKYFTLQGDEYLIKGEEDPVLNQDIKRFIDQFGLTNIPDIGTYIYQVFVEQLNGYEIDKMADEDFKHVGGPIILNNLKN